MSNRQNQDREGNKPASDSEASVSQKRRRLIKGLVAATPGIFTLHSGAAQAMLSSRQCAAMNQKDFDGRQEFAGEDHEVDGYMRLAEQEGIHVVAETRRGHKEKWLVSVMDEVGQLHYIEAGYEGKQGVTWNKVLNRGMEWRLHKSSGAGLPGSPLKFHDPVTGRDYTQKFDKIKRIKLLACVDDEGHIVSAYPKECDAKGLAPPSGSCWASIGTSKMNHWWG
ncbi:MAG: hypothetical protein BMS9Abin08_0058 [Gammaproteobacteria bacterium]|nr:MAG: hypothetical protein BMS9Abin08_0058 [Gammaproteobacteria bacterium]